MGILRTNTLSGIGTDGPVFDGVTRLDTFGYVVPPVGVTSDRTLAGVTTAQGSIRFNTDSQKLEFFAQDQWFEMVIDTPDLAVGSNTGAGARGVWGGGRVGAALQTIIDYINISSAGNAINFGNLSQARRRVSACASSTRGVWGGGYDPDRSTIDFVTISSTGTAASFGSLTTSRRTPGSLSNSTRGIWAGGSAGAGAGVLQNIIDYITIASTGNAVDYGDLTIARDGPQGVSSPVRGVFGGGYAAPAHINVIDYITISTLGNATDFGDLVVTVRSCGGCSNATRGIFGGGYTPTAVNTIQYVTIASLGNAVRFGDLTRVGGPMQAVSSPTRGVWAGGYVPGGETNIIDYVIIPTQGNAVDFGDLTVSRAAGGGCSNAHGGL